MPVLILSRRPCQGMDSSAESGMMEQLHMIPLRRDRRSR